MSTSYPENLFNTIFDIHDESTKSFTVYWKEYRYTKEMGERLIKIINNDVVDEISIKEEIEREIIKLKYNDGFSLKKIGEVFNLSTERVRQIYNKTLRKLRNPTRSLFILSGKLPKPKKQEIEFNNGIFWYIDEETPIVDFEIRKNETRIRNCCMRHGLEIFGDILNISKDELYNIKGLGRTSIESIIEYFEKLDINVDRFKDEN